MKGHKLDTKRKSRNRKPCEGRPLHVLFTFASLVPNAAQDRLVFNKQFWMNWPLEELVVVSLQMKSPPNLWRSPAGSLTPQPMKTLGQPMDATGRACLVQGDATGVVVLSPTGLALLGPQDASHAALLLQVGHTAVLLGCPATQVCLSPTRAPAPILSVTPPGGTARPIAQTRKRRLREGSPCQRPTASKDRAGGGGLGKASASPTKERGSGV